MTTDHDRGLFLSLVGVLLGFGILMVHSASITSWPTEFERVYLSRHVAFLIVAALSGILAASMPARFWYRVAPWLFVVTVGLLVLVAIPGVGTRVNGAQRWLRFGSISMQPSELAKIAVPLMIARGLSLRRDRLGGLWSGTVPLLAPLLIVVPLVAIQPDLGTALFLVFGTGILLFLGGWPLRNFLFGAAAGIPAAMLLVTLKPYQMKRITGYLAAWSDFREAPYQLQQSLVSLGAGGTWGVGVGKGWQKLSFLPEANTDFVFAVVGEELGLVGTLGLIGLWAGIFFAGLRLLKALPAGSFERNVGMTLLAQIALQAALNIAVVTALVPPKGIPHPMLSYGGSNLVVSVTSLAMVLSLTRDPARVRARETSESVGE